MRKRSIILTCLLCLMAMYFVSPAFAVDPVAEEAGFSGFIRPGVGYLDMESNMVAEFLGWDLTSDPINSLTASPEGESNAMVLFAFKINYTFDNLATEVFLGTELIDLARFDMSQQVGIKHKVGNYGILQAGFLLSGLAAEVWSDPYVTGRNRSTTDRDSSGVRLAWGEIMGSNFDLTYTYRKIDIDNEQSGVTQLSLTAAQRKLLERDGNTHNLEVKYAFDFGDNHKLMPAFTYVLDDCDGDARTNDEYTFQLSYAYLGADPFSFSCNGVIGWADYDKANPISAFNGQTQEDDIYGLGATIYYKNPWGWSLWGSKPVTFYLEGGWYQRDANIDFYDEQVTVGTVGALFRW